ncbi:hypothetical protein SAMN05920897_11539 [Alkalispirochaeta americana]|uniref:Uncharacterized protein n=2 Tax=Alkalispirochaeta americana TaxID=159291 RepID=A0A1N6VPH8_9SPIO|nr:hypothetical protein SAMN05920897_11539 [Alkalispirochaeta americana]
MFDPLRSWLEGQGYLVSAEVKYCDLVARSPEKPEEFIVIEMKTRLSLDLLFQAARRKALTEAVYIAVPLRGSKSSLRKGRALQDLLRRLEVGLLVVRFLQRTTRIEVLLHPQPFQPRTARRRRIEILREIDGRYAEFDRGGLPGGAPRLTAWRQRSLRVAQLLLARDEASPAELRQAGAPAQTQQILSKNSYGWFDRIRRGTYRLSPAGTQALSRYQEILPDLEPRVKRDDHTSTPRHGLGRNHQEAP